MYVSYIVLSRNGIIAYGVKRMDEAEYRAHMQRSRGSQIKFRGADVTRKGMLSGITDIRTFFGLVLQIWKSFYV